MRVVKLLIILLIAFLFATCSGNKSIPCQECGATMEKTYEEEIFLGLKEQFECDNCGNWVIYVAGSEVNNRKMQEESDMREELRRIKQAKLDSLNLRADSLERAYRVAYLNSGIQYEFEFGETKAAKRMKIEMADLEYEYKKVGGDYWTHHLY